jgi:hypothetical protein
MWLMELALGVSAMLFEGWFGGAVVHRQRPCCGCVGWSSSGMRARAVRVTCNADGAGAAVSRDLLPLPVALFAVLCVGVSTPSSSSHQVPPFRFPTDPRRRRPLMLYPSQLWHGMLVPLLVLLCLSCISSQSAFYFLAWCEM